MYNELSKLNSKKENNPIGKWAKTTKGRFISKDVRKADEHMKTCPTSLATKETQIKATKSCHYTNWDGWNKNTDKSGAGKDAKKLDPSDTAEGNVKWYGHSGKVQ